MRYKQDLAEFLPIADGARLIQERVGITEDEAREDIVVAVRDRALGARWWSVIRGDRRQYFTSDLPHGFLDNLTPDLINWKNSVARRRGVGASFTVEIEVKRDDLSKLYPLLADDSAKIVIKEGAKDSTIGSETRCKEWLVGLMSGTGRPKKTKATFKAEAQEEFGIGTKAFDRAWASAATEAGADDWIKAGRKS